jgi:hypothetical protein
MSSIIAGTLEAVADHLDRRTSASRRPLRSGGWRNTRPRDISSMKRGSSAMRSRKSERIDTTTRSGAAVSSATPASAAVNARRSLEIGDERVELLELIDEQQDLPPVARARVRDHGDVRRRHRLGSTRARRPERVVSAAHARERGERLAARAQRHDVPALARCLERGPDAGARRTTTCRRPTADDAGDR